MSLGWTQILIVVILLVLLFGRGRVASLMSEVAKGIKGFRAGMKDDEPADSGTNSDSTDNKD